jgi:hypothetical protein
MRFHRTLQLTRGLLRASGVCMHAWVHADLSRRRVEPNLSAAVRNRIAGDLTTCHYLSAHETCADFASGFLFLYTVSVPCNLIFCTTYFRFFHTFKQKSVPNL